MQSRELVKLYYRIGEVSEIVGVQPHVLRYWETEFRSIRPQKSSKGQRVYSRRDVEKLLKVKDLLRNQGFTIAGARKRLNESSAPGSSSSPRPHPEPASALTGDLAGVKSAPAASAGLAEPRAEGGPQLALRSAGGEPVVEGRAAETGSADAPRAGVHPDVEAPPEAALAGGRAVSPGGAKDMRKALLALRRELLGMLDDCSALRRP
jgi:DNA-binding transcriptional MerR regulator